MAIHYFCNAKTNTHLVQLLYGRLEAFLFRTKEFHNIIKLYSLLVTVTETKYKFIKNGLEKNQGIS